MKSTIVKCEICGKLQEPVWEAEHVMRHVCCMECGVRVIDAAMDFADHVKENTDDEMPFKPEEFRKFLYSMIASDKPETDPANN